MARQRSRQGRSRQGRSRRGRRRGRADTVALWSVGFVLAGFLLYRLWIFATAHAAATLTVLAVLVTLLGGAGYAVLAARRREADRMADLDRAVAVTDGMSGPQFERYIARLMSRDGFRRVTVCGGAGDLGADVVGYTRDGRRVVVQCKRLASTLGDPHVQKFNGTVWQVHRADVALLVTTGRPTANAWRLADQFGITIVDRIGLATWAADGVPPVSVRPPAGSRVARWWPIRTAGPGEGIDDPDG